MTANTNYPDNITALYARLSQEDALDGESNSIANHARIFEWRCGPPHIYVWTQKRKFRGTCPRNFRLFV